MDTENIKSFYEMSNRELFCTLTGDNGFLAQQLLQDIVRKYLAKYSETKDLQTMVRAMIDENEV